MNLIPNINGALLDNWTLGQVSPTIMAQTEWHKACVNANKLDANLTTKYKSVV